MRFARGYRKFVANCVDSVLELALKSPFTTIIIIAALTVINMFGVKVRVKWMTLISKLGVS